MLEERASDAGCLLQIEVRIIGILIQLVEEFQMGWIQLQKDIKLNRLKNKMKKT